MEGNISSEEHRFPREDKRKEEKMPLYTCKSSGWLIHPAHKGSKFPIRACLSLTRFCVQVQQMAVLRKTWKLVQICHQPYFTEHWIWMNRISFFLSLKEKFKKHRTLPLSQQSLITGASISLHGQHGFPMSWNPAGGSYGPGAREGGRHWPLTSAQAQQDQCKAHPSMFEVCPVSFKKFF